MVYHVGSPAMFDGNRFLPDTGTPIWKMLRNSTVFADCDPEPFTVATWMLKSFTLRRLAPASATCSCRPTSSVAISVHSCVRLVRASEEETPHPRLECRDWL